MQLEIEYIVLESSRYMDLRKEQKDWVQKEISRSVQEHLSPTGWRKITTWMQVGVWLGLFLGLVTLAVAALGYAWARVEKEAVFQTQTTDSLKTMQKDLTDIKGIIALIQVPSIAQKYSKVPVKELAAHREELHTLKKELQSVSPDTPNFYPASFNVINLLSLATWQLETVGKTPPSFFSDVTLRGVSPSTVTGRNVFLKGHIEGFSFVSSVVHFDPSVVLVNVSFTNCVLVLPIQDNPSKPMQNLGQLLLASDLSHITVPST